MMGGHPPTKTDKAWYRWIFEMYGCWCCVAMGELNREEDLLPHHTRGRVIEHANLRTIPLCDPHHIRYKKTGLHYNETRWCERWASIVPDPGTISDPQDRIVRYLHELRAASMAEYIRIHEYRGPLETCINPISGEIYEVLAA